MAGAAVIGALRVVLGADTAALDKGLKDSQAGLASFGNFTRGMMEGLAASISGAAAGIGVSIKSAIDSADKINKASQSTGLSVEEFSKLKYAAELSDVSTESLGKSMGKLSKAMIAAATEGASPAAQAFTAMGISVKNQDGTLRSSSDVFKDLAEKFSNYKDSAEKTKLAIDLFGKAGAAMIPLLNQGRTGLEETGAEAEKFGLVLDKKTTLAAEAFNDNLKKMDAIKQGLYTTITAKMLPAFEMWSEQLLAVKANSNFTTMAADGITTSIKFVVQEVMLATVSFRGLANELKAVWEVLNASDWASVKAAWSTYIAVSDETRKSIDGVKSSLSNLWTNNPQPDWGSELLGIRSMQKEVALLGGEWAKTTAPIISAADATKNALQMFLDSQAKRIAGQEAEAATIGKSIGAQAALKLQYEAQAIALAKGIALGPAQIAQITAAGDAASLSAMKVTAANIAIQAMNPAEKFAFDMAQLQQVYLTTSMTAETFAARQRQLAEGIGATWQQVGSTITGQFSQLAGAFAKNNKTMGTAAKAFGIAQAIINTEIGITKAIASYGLTPLGYAAIAGTIAQGAASVATIAAQGFARGGIVTGPGTGMSDSIPAMLSHGEFVMNADATRRFGPELEAMNSGHSGGGEPAHVTVNWAGNVVGREGLRHLFDEMNGMFADGYKLKLA